MLRAVGRSDDRGGTPGGCTVSGLSLSISLLCSPSEDYRWPVNAVDTCCHVPVTKKLRECSTITPGYCNNKISRGNRTDFSDLEQPANTANQRPCSCRCNVLKTKAGPFPGPASSSGKSKNLFGFPSRRAWRTERPLRIREDPGHHRNGAGVPRELGRVDLIERIGGAVVVVEVMLARRHQAEPHHPGIRQWTGVGTTSGEEIMASVPTASSGRNREWSASMRSWEREVTNPTGSVAPASDSTVAKCCSSSSS